MAEINSAMVLAAGFGKRLRPITETIPKPLVPVGGRTMLDRALDTVQAAGISCAVVNVHYLGAQIIDHCAARAAPRCDISDERDAILETGGGVVKALPLLGDQPFALLNADTFWIDGPEPALPAMMGRFDPGHMDMLLLLAPLEDTTGHSGGRDFTLHHDMTLTRGGDEGHVYAGAAIINPSIFADAAAQRHSLNVYFDRAIGAGRLYGYLLQGGHWITVGTPDGLIQAEKKLAGLG
ncbi:MAG: nucleotidyltransferase family protein [Ahrensia sp.]